MCPDPQIDSIVCSMTVVSSCQNALQAGQASQVRSMPWFASMRFPGPANLIQPTPEPKSHRASTSKQHLQLNSREQVSLQAERHYVYVESLLPSTDLVAVCLGACSGVRDELQAASCAQDCVVEERKKG